MAELFLPLALLGNSLTAGGLLVVMVSSAPLRLALSADRAVQVHQLLTKPMEPLMPICMALGIVSDVAFQFTTEHHAAGILCGIAATMQLKAVLVSLTKNVRINRWMASLDHTELPSDFAERDPRAEWRKWNRIRALCALCALLLNIVAVGLMI